MIFSKFGFTKIKVGKKYDQMSEPLVNSQKKIMRTVIDEMTFCYCGGIDGFASPIDMIAEVVSFLKKTLLLALA